MKKKRNDVKKKNCAGKLGYCPSSSFGSRYNVLYYDRQVAQARSKGHDTTSSVSRDGQPRARHGRPARGASDARARGLAAGVSRDTMVCIVAGGGRCVTI